MQYFSTTVSADGHHEPLYTIQQAAITLNIHIWKLRRAVKSGLIPSYTIWNSRRLVRLSEVVAAINEGRKQ
jgi:excisionase family DNA binding protein